MGLAIEIAGYGVPAAVAVALVLVCRRALPRAASRRCGPAIGFATAFITGYVLLPDWAALNPTRNWHWLPYLGAVCMLMGPVGQARGLLTIERWLLYALVAVFAAWLLVPTWPDIQPMRVKYIAFLAAGLFLLTALLEPLPDRINGSRFFGYLTVAAGATAVLLAALFSLSLGQVCGVAAAALAGCFAASLWDSPAAAPRGLVLGYAVVVGGMAFVGALPPKPPQFGLLLVPAAPLALWIRVVPSVTRLGSRTVVLIEIAAMLLAIGAAVCVIMLGLSD